MINKIIISLIFFWILSFAKAYAQSYNGKWVVKNNKYIDIELDLKQKVNTITGTHSIVYGIDGNYIDLPDVNQITINGIVANGLVTLDLMSQYINNVVKITLKLLPDGKLEWKLITRPKDLFFYPDSIILEKEN